LTRLPQNYQIVIFLCDLEGKTRKEVARQLRLPVGTVASRLARARAMLAKRLARHGLVLSGVTLAAALTERAMATTMPPQLTSSTLKAAALVAVGQAAALRLISPDVSTLTEGTLKAMLLNKLKTMICLLAVVVVISIGIAGLIRAAQLPGQVEAAQPEQQRPNEQKKDGAPVDDAKVVGGLRIRLQLPKTQPGKKQPTECAVTLENVGDFDLNVKLGFSLANGKSHHPDALSLIALAKGDKARMLVYAPLPGVAGRVDPYVVPMPAGSSYTLRCKFENYVDAATGDRVDLTAKDYRIAAELTGEAIKHTNLDVQGLALISCWQGTARSNEILLLSTKVP
jgi:hypothetical protein